MPGKEAKALVHTRIERLEDLGYTQLLRLLNNLPSEETVRQPSGRRYRLTTDSFSDAGDVELGTIHVRVRARGVGRHVLHRHAEGFYRSDMRPIE